jgi:uncharacterized protein YjeT (DUF2065 family)
VAEAVLGAFALLLVIEGLLPFVAPARWKKVFEEAVKLSDGQIRFFGLCSILAGLLLLAMWG